MIYGKHSVWTPGVSKANVIKLLDSLIGSAVTTAQSLVEVELADKRGRLPKTSFWGQGRGSIASLFVVYENSTYPVGLLSCAGDSASSVTD